MTFCVKRILLKNGDLITEREMSPNEHVFDGPTPVVGDIISMKFRGGRLNARVIWGNWSGREGLNPPDLIVPLRVEEI